MYTFRLADMADKDAIIKFMRTYWDSPHPLIEIPELFNYYYCANDGSLRFALCETNGNICALAGYIPSCTHAPCDVWLSLWVADPAAKGSGLELMDALPSLIGCRTLSCNNIRPKTMPFYNFLGHTSGRMSHFYRLLDKPVYTVARVASKEILPVFGDARLELLADETALINSGFTPPEAANPYKDMDYIIHRYFAYPHQSYDVYAVFLPGDIIPCALLCTRLIAIEGTFVLRIADYIGDADILPQMGSTIAALMQKHDAEYADFYCVGIPAETMAKAGFSQRVENDANIIPNYLSPPLYENTEYYYFTSHPDGFVMCKADGDQDRPNLSF